MTPICRSFIVFTLFATATGAALAQQPAFSAPPLVTTHGSAEIRVTPDLADLQFQIEVRNADLAAARKEQAERVTKVLAALRAAGVIDAELQTSQVRISPVFSDRREIEKARFYSVSQEICCTVHDVKSVPDVTATALNAGANIVLEASLRTSQLRKYRDQARIKAIQAAREKATALAGELGSKIGKPYSITEGGYYNWRASSLGNNSNFQQVSAAGGEGAGEADSPTFAAGTISISAEVTVAFVLE